jgi:hypothetical protein
MAQRMGNEMKRLAFAFIALTFGAGLSFAKDAKVMSDSEMDGVVAGGIQNPGLGVATAWSTPAGPTGGNHLNNGLQTTRGNEVPGTGGFAGFGMNTASGVVPD